VSQKQVFRAPAKISVACPHCGATQKESIHAQTTLCRSCGEHFQIGTVPAPAARTPHAGPGGTGMSILATLARWLPKVRIGERNIRCYQCGHGQKVSTSAKSTMCAKCNSYIELQDYKITSAFSRLLRTQGRLVLTAKGDLASTKAYCSSALIEGNIRGQLFCSGTLEIRRKGRINGAIEADHVLIGRKADVELVRPLHVGQLDVAGRLSADIRAVSGVKISSKGKLRGTVVARSFSVDKGGEFHGQLTIGIPDMSGAELFGGVPDSKENPQLDLELPLQQPLPETGA